MSVKTKDIVVWTVTIISMIWAYAGTFKDIMEGNKSDDYFTDDE